MPLANRSSGRQWAEKRTAPQLPKIRAPVGSNIGVSNSAATRRRCAHDPLLPKFPRRIE